MLDNLDEGSDVLSAMYGESEQEPTEKPEVEAKEVETNTETQESEPAESQGEEESESEELVLDEKSDFVKYEYDDETGLYSFKSNGKSVKINHDQLIQKFQEADKNGATMESLAKERKAFETEKQERINDLKGQSERYKENADRLEELIKASDEAIDWEELRETDTAEYLKQKELKEKRTKALEQSRADRAKALEERRNTVIQRESEAFKNVVNVSGEELDKLAEGMSDYVSNKGFSDDEMKSLLDHRFWTIAVDGMRYQQLKQKTVKEDVKTPGKIESKRTQDPKDKKQDAPIYDKFYDK